MFAFGPGGKAHLFLVEQLEDQIFKFSVSSRNVGFMVINQSSVICELFGLSFFLLNDIVFSKALKFAKKVQGPHSLGKRLISK